MDAPGGEVDTADVPLDEEHLCWRCAACGAEVSDPDQVVSVDGGPAEQTFANPAGYLFTLVTVRTVRNVSLIGPPQHEFSWFSGRSWRVATCRGCGTHLGWSFQGQDRFVGLIRTRLREG